VQNGRLGAVSPYNIERSSRVDDRSDIEGELSLEAAVLVEDGTLHDWQLDAVTAWKEGDDKGRFRGTLEIFTGGGKTLIALAAFGAVSRSEPRTKLAVVVPTEALARQWVTQLVDKTSLTDADIGMLGAGRSDQLDDHRALVAVINSAAK
jgi:superfamily II DNA or RNA helicase